MDNAINSIILDKNEFTIEDAKEAAKQIFETQTADFYEIKEEKWYKRLLNAITLGAGRKKKVIKDIRSLSKLQTIFMRVYSEHYKDVDAQLNALIDNLSQTNIVVKKLYETCVLGIKPQAGIEQMPMLDREVLLLTVANYKSVNDKENELKKYRASLAKAASINMPEGQFNTELLEKVDTVDVFYRCMAEMRAIDESDFMPETIAVALENLNISNNAKKKIDELVSIEVDSFGIGYIVNKYSDGEEDIWGDVELTLVDDEKAQTAEAETLVESSSIEDAMPIGEYEDEVISNMLHINRGEVKRFKNKNIHIQKYIKCEGVLEIDNCVLYYNENDFSDEISFDLYDSEDTGLYIRNSIVICEGVDEKVFINAPAHTCKTVVFENVIFVNCSYFFKGVVHDLRIKKCRLENCGDNFIDVKVEEGDSCDISENVIIQNDVSKFCLDYYKKDISGKLFSVVRCTRGCDDRVIFSDNTVIEEESFRKAGNFKYDNSIMYAYIEGIIQKCTFIGISRGIWANVIKECKFEDSSAAISGFYSGYTVKMKTIDNCVFDGCTNVITTCKGLKISNCQFVSCYDEIIHPTDYDGGVDIEFCEFINVKNGAIRFSNGYLPSMFGIKSEHACIVFTRSESRDSVSNHMTKCIFDGVELDNNFLIMATDSYKEPRGKVATIEDCDFRNCTTKRASGKVIKEHIVYEALFGKEKDFLAVTIQNCRGLDKINKEGCSAETAITRTVSTTGNAIGSKVMAGVAKGMAINALGLVGGPIAMGIGAVAMGAYEKLKKK